MLHHTYEQIQQRTKQINQPKVKRLSRSDIHDNQKKRKRQRQSIGIIRVTIYSSNNIHEKRQQNERHEAKSQDYSKSDASLTSVSKIHRSDGFLSQSNQNISKNNLSRSSNVICPETLNRSTSKLDNTIDYHRNSRKNKKRTFLRQCIIICILIGCSLLSIILAILLPLIIKPPSVKPNVTVLRWNTTGVTVAGISGLPGNTSDQLNVPYDVKIDDSYTLYIADRGNNRVQKYLRGTSVGITVAGQSNSSTGFTPYHLKLPSGVLIHSNGDVYVVDTANYRVQLWPKGASFGSTVAGSGTNLSSQLQNPYGLALDTRSDTLYIADQTFNRIMCYLSGASLGTVAAGGNNIGTNNTQLWWPVGLYFDLFSNSLIIGNFKANNIVRWIIGDDHWTLLAGDINGTEGNTSTLLNAPQGVTLDPMGNIFVADRSNRRIQFFPYGQLDGITIAGITGVSGADSTLLNTPVAVTLDNQLNLYVADPNNHRIQMFQRY